MLGNSSAYFFTCASGCATLARCVLAFVDGYKQGRSRCASVLLCTSLQVYALHMHASVSLRKLRGGFDGSFVLDAKPTSCLPGLPDPLQRAHCWPTFLSRVQDGIGIRLPPPRAQAPSW
eukprot:scaffold73_cov337-Pavlova_lutheri.AAC.47